MFVPIRVAYGERIAYIYGVQIVWVFKERFRINGRQCERTVSLVHTYEPWQSLLGVIDIR